MEQLAGAIVGTAAAMFLFNWGFTGFMLLIGAGAKRAWYVIAGALIVTAVDYGLAAIDPSPYADLGGTRVGGQFLAALAAGGIGVLIGMIRRRIKRPAGSQSGEAAA